MPDEPASSRAAGLRVRLGAPWLGFSAGGWPLAEGMAAAGGTILGDGLLLGWAAPTVAFTPFA